MERIDSNIDAYRIVAEILAELRGAVRRVLESRHGREWPRHGLPQPTLERLIDRKEREKSIDWYETEYQELTDFAGFEDLLEILEHNPGIMEEVRKLAPSQALLHARFLELEVMRSKLGLARPISDNELSFLGTFHLRFRKALEAQRHAAPTEPALRAPEPVPPPAEPVPEAEAVVEFEEQTKPAAPTPTPMPAPAPPSAAAPARASAPSRSLRPPSAAAAAERSPAAPSSAPPVAPAPERSPLEIALEQSDHRTIFRDLYREVMEIAEGLWTTDVPTVPRVWDKVRVSPWYEQNFSRRGLQPLSDFYGVVAQVWERMRQGIARDELQEFLKQSSFAQLLLALRDMFQKNQV